MSEFKFACPVCGQHITADDSNSGGQIECPTCFRKIVVPQAPATQDTKFILSASQVAKPRPVGSEAASQPGSLAAPASRSPVPVLIVGLVLLGAAGAALYVFRDRIFKPAPAPKAAQTNTHAAAPKPPLPFHSAYSVPTNFAWTLDLAKEAIPETTAAGRIHGNGFACEMATLQGGILSLRQGKRWPPDLGVTVLLGWRPGEDMSGRSVEITPERPRAPRVILRWKDEQRKAVTETIHRGYALKLSFGQAANGRMPGKLYLCLPDEAKSFVAGTFDAEIRQPREQRPRPPQPKG